MVPGKMPQSHPALFSSPSVAQLQTTPLPKRLGVTCALAGVVCCLALSPAQTARAAAKPSTQASAGAHARPAADFGKVPLSFEPNRGQADSQVQFLARGRGYALFLAAGHAVLSLQQPAATDVLDMELIGANAAVSPAGVDRQPGVVNYFNGQNPKNWHTAIPTYAQVKSSDIYPGIDLVFYGNQRQLEYDFVVAPGADPRQIAWNISGAAPSLDKEGNLLLQGLHGPVRFKKPEIYQMERGSRVNVDGAYTIAGNQVRFALGPYDRKRTLTIDPVLIYASYLGGASEAGYPTMGDTTIGSFTGLYPTGISNPTQGLAIDGDGDVYVAGYTNATNFPLHMPYQSKKGGINTDYRAADAFVTKFNAEGTALIYSTYLSGGSDAITAATSIAVDAQGNAYVAGYTDDGNYPVTSGAFQTICGANWSGNGASNPTRINGCAPEAQQSGFLTKIDPTGQTLLYSTFLGGMVADQIFAVAVDAQGQAYVAGNSDDYCDPRYDPSWACFPTTSGAVLSGFSSYVLLPDSDYGSFTGNAFVTVFDASGSSLLYSTYVGDNTALISSGAASQSSWGPTNASAVAVDSAGDFFLTGVTEAPNLPTTSGAFQSTPAIPGCCEGFVAKFAPIASSGSSLTYLTYLSGTVNGAYPSGIAADGAGEAYVVGENQDQDFPTTAGAYQTSCGFSGDNRCTNAFITKLNSSGTGLVWSTMLGDEINANNIPAGAVGPVQLDSQGDVFVTGQSSGYYPDFPQVNPIQAVTGGNLQPFVTELDPTGSQVLFSTFFGSGGMTWQNAAGLAVDDNGNIYLAGNTNGTGIPVTAGAFQRAFVGQNDGYIAKLSLEFLTSTTTLTITPEAPVYGQTVTFTAKVKGPTGSPTAAGTVIFMNGDAPLGTVTLGGSGTATLTDSSLPASTYSITAVYSGDSNFTPGSSTAHSVTIGVANPPLTWPAPAAITYGTPLSATQLDASSTVPGTFKYAPAAGTKLGAGSHTLYVTFTPTDTVDYKVRVLGTTITVAQASPSLTWTTPAAIPYGTALGSKQLDAKANVAGTLSYSPAAGTILTAGAQTLTATFTPKDSTDYTTATAEVTLTVNPVNPPLTWPTPAPITYGTPLSSTQLDASSTVPGTFKYAPPAGTVLKAGTHVLWVTFTPTDTVDYKVRMMSTTLEVNPAS